MSSWREMSLFGDEDMTYAIKIYNHKGNDFNSGALGSGENI
jgi:hypothetical protein